MQIGMCNKWDNHGVERERERERERLFLGKKKEEERERERESGLRVTAMADSVEEVPTCIV